VQGFRGRGGGGIGRWLGGQRTTSPLEAIFLGTLARSLGCDAFDDLCQLIVGHALLAGRLLDNFWALRWRNLRLLTLADLELAAPFPLL